MASLPNRIAALLTGLTRDQIAAMSPATRQQLADQCERVLRISRAGANPPAKAGVLARLQDGERAS